MTRARGARLDAHTPRRSARRRTSPAGAGRDTTPDQATRQRVFDVAVALFAEYGFRRVTVRQIAAAARANVAAVNYHFGDKAGLYDAIVESAIAAMRETGTQARAAGEGLAPADQLRAFIRVFVTRVTGHGHLSWIHRLMTRELDDPTESLTRIMREVMEPRTAYLGGIVAAITGLPADDPRTARAVASIHGQLLVFCKPMPPKFPAKWKVLTADVDAVVDHITVFSLYGLAGPPDSSPRHDDAR